MTDVTSTTTGKRCLRRTILAVSALLTVMNSVRVEAIEYTWPMITAVEVTSISGDYRQYKLTWSVVTVRDDTIAPNTPVKQVYKTKTGYPAGDMSSSIRVRTKDHNNHITGGTVTGIVRDSNNSLERYSQRMSEYFPTYTTVYGTSVPNEPEQVCLMTSDRASVNSTNNMWTELTALNWDGGIGIGGGCIGTPPVNQWCALVSPAVEIAYGTMSVADAVGAQKSSNVSVSCTTGMKYTLRLRGADTISLSNGMHAELEADGRPLNSTLNGVAGMNNVILSSTLNGEPVRTGEFKGEGVLFVSYP